MKEPRRGGYASGVVLLEAIAGSLAATLALGVETVPRRVVVLPPQVDGQAEGLDASVAAAMGEAVEEAGAEAIAAPDGCVDISCGAEAAGDDGYVLVTTVTVTDSDYALESRLVDSRGEVVENRRDACDICTPAEAAGRAGALAKELVGPVSTVEVERIREPVAEPAKKSTDRSRLYQGLGFAAIGVGAAALISGVALLALNNRSVQGSCEGDGVDADGNCEYLWNTLGGGIGLTVGGVVVAGGGVGLLVYNKKRNGRTESQVSVGPGRVEVRF